LESSSQLEIPEKVRRKAALMGETGLAWLANLQQHIVELNGARRLRSSSRRDVEEKPLLPRRAPGSGWEDCDSAAPVTSPTRRDGPKMAAPGRLYTSAIAARFR